MTALQSEQGTVINRKERDSAQVIADILRVVKEEPCRKTPLFRSANLNHVRGNEYLEACMKLGLLQEQDEHYRATEKGIEYLRYWRKIEKRLSISDDGYGAADHGGYSGDY